MTVLYLSLEISPADKQKLHQLVEEEIRKEDLCFLKRKGGNVTAKAHLTLAFGFQPEEYQKLSQDPRLAELKGDFLIIQDFEIFKLKKAPCDALVMRVKNDKLEKLHRYFIEKYKIAAQYQSQLKRAFKPHITLAYISKDAFIDPPTLRQKLLALKLSKLNIETVKVKRYG